MRPVSYPGASLSANVSPPPGSEEEKMAACENDGLSQRQPVVVEEYGQR